jgi:5'-nucleotidase
VTLATLGAFGPAPDLVLSGINRGHNIGVPIFHSGTVAAALTAAGQGVSGVAISIQGIDPVHWSTAATMAGEALAWIAAEPVGTALSLNVPDLPIDELAGVRHATLTPITRERLVATTAPTGEPMIAVAPLRPDPPAGSDEALLRAGYVTVSPLVGIRVLPEDDAAIALAKRLSSYR